MSIKRTASLAAAALVAMAGLSGRAQQRAIDWPAVSGDAGAMKYSPADQITPANVTQMKEAWSYTPGGAWPIVVRGVMYFAGGANVFALNAETGAEVWKFALA